MATPIAMPKLGMTMREGRVVSWARAPGERVEKGAPVVVIESEKSEVEIEATASGVLRHVYVGPDETVPCGTLLGAIADAMDAPFDAQAFHREHDRPELPAPASAGTATGARPLAAPRRDAVPTTPAARALAKQLGVDPARVPGTGPGGRITREDVEAFAARASARVTVADGVALDVPSDGQGDVVALLPGFGCDATLFARQVPALVSRFRVRAVNPRGIAGSDGPEDDAYTVGRMAADVAALLDAPAHVVGASLGAAVALELALTRPERVRSLVLLTPLVAVGTRLDAVLEAWCGLVAAGSLELAARALLPWLFSPTRTLADAAARARTVRGLAAMMRQTPAATLARQAAGLRQWSGTRRDDLARVGVPTTVIAATDDLLTPDAGAIARAVPRAALVEIRDAGHAVMLEAPDETNEALASHLG